METPNRIATVGQLRAALEGIPDDTPLTVNAADLTGPAAEEQVITSTGFGLIDWGDGYGLEPDNVFALNCDRPAGIPLRSRPARPARRAAAAQEARVPGGDFTAQFAQDISVRARWARRHNDGEPKDAWSTGEKLAVALVLANYGYLDAAGYSRDEARSRLAGDLMGGDVDAWLDQVRATLLPRP